MSKVNNSLDKLSLKDTYSLIMFVLFRCQGIPEIAPLSQLIYLVDEDVVIKLLKYFGGQTITFPKLKDLEVLIYTLTLYQEVEIEGKSFEERVNLFPEEFRSEILDLYNKVCSVMEDYSFVQE